MTQLSEHFTLHEAIRSSTAERLGINNTPNDMQIANAKIAAGGMEHVRVVLRNKSIHVDSWIRVEELEKVLTRKDFVRWCNARSLPPDNEISWQKYFIRKAHPKGFAVDFVCPAFGTPAEVAKAIRDSAIKFDQLIMEGSWVHISFAPEMRQQVLLATFHDGTPSYTQTT